MSALVSICIATFKRPEGLKRLILGLNQLTFSTATPPDIEIVIVDNASDNTSFIAIIDDDEVPDSQWLDQLLKVQREYNADVVTGPVYPYFEDKNTPEWIKKGQFFEPRNYETGHLLNAAFTNNVLIRAECLKGINPVFDQRFAFKGAEDTHTRFTIFTISRKIGGCQITD
jgi:glycosyltransferase involved in cell wall biosynthesis